MGSGSKYCSRNFAIMPKVERVSEEVRRGFQNQYCVVLIVLVLLVEACSSGRYGPGRDKEGRSINPKFFKRALANRMFCLAAAFKPIAGCVNG